MKIVIVDDDEVSRLVLRKTLEGLGFEVVALADGVEAWDHLRDHEAQVVITDWMMPGLDGLELCQRLRARGVGPYTYVILLTVRDAREDRLEALQSGADDLLAKPLDRAELMARLTVARRIIGMAERLRSHSAELVRIHDELERRNARLAEIASCDELTGLKNRRHFREAMRGHLSLATRRGLSLSLVMIDVDQFKTFNDSFGHPAGDRVLVQVARLLRHGVRDSDVVARYGGEEFAVLLPSSDVEASRALSERLRDSIERHPWPLRPITISLGISTIEPRAAEVSAMIEQADRSLYRSKAEGRNRLTHAADFPPAPDLDRLGEDDDALPETDPEGREIAPFLA